MAQDFVERAEQFRTIGHQDDRAAARLERRLDIQQRSPIVVNVLNYIEADYGIEPLFDLRERLKLRDVAVRYIQVWMVFAQQAQAIQIERVDVARDIALTWHELAREISDTTANLEDFLATVRSES